MKKLVLISLLFTLSLHKTKAVNDTLFVFYLENFPYSYTENKIVKGMEIDIINEYVNWVKNDGINLTPIYKSFSEFDSLFDAVKKGKSNVIGLGSVTINTERLKYVSFSPPYLKNVSVLITDGATPIITSKNELSTVLHDYRTVTLKNSMYEKYLLDIKKHSLPKLKFNYTDSDLSAIDSVANHKNVFAYCDILSYLTYTREHKNVLLKIQKPFTFNTDNLGFIVPKNSKHTKELSEFFESGYGFIVTKKYIQILEAYLSSEVIQEVKIN